MVNHESPIQTTSLAAMSLGGHDVPPSDATDDSAELPLEDSRNVGVSLADVDIDVESERDVDAESSSLVEATPESKPSGASPSLMRSPVHATRPHAAALKHMARLRCSAAPMS